MRVGFDISQAVYGTGVSDYTTELASHLPSDILVLVGFALKRSSQLKTLFPKSSVYPISPTLLHLLWNKLHVVNFENFAPGKIDIYHSSDWAQAPDSSRKVTTVHDMSPFRFPKETSAQIVSVHTARLHWVATECDKIICVSKSTEDDLHSYFPKTIHRTVVIPEALPSRFDVDARPKSLGQPLVVIGSRQKRKNITSLLAAFSTFGHKYRLPDQMLVIGEPPDTNVSIPAGVTFTGVLSDQDLVDTVASASCLINPSIHEGFGLPILVAFRHSIPVACSDINVFHEVAGNAASYFQPKDLEDIALGISKALKNHKSQVAAGKKQLSSFSWTKTAADTLKLYTQLI